MRGFYFVYVLILALLAAAVWNHAAEAKVTYNEATKVATITGATEPNQTYKVFLLFKEHEVKNVIMYGPGGFLKEVKVMSNLFRQEGVSVVVPRGRKCVSACAFIAMSGKHTHVLGSLLFHRPYIPSIPVHANLDEINGIGQQISVDLARHFIEYGYTLEFLGQIARKTNPCTFLVVEKTEQLRKFKGEPLDRPFVLTSLYKSCNFF